MRTLSLLHALCQWLIRLLKRTAELVDRTTLRVKGYDSRITLRLQGKLRKNAMKIPRVWLLVGGETCGDPDFMIKRRFPAVVQIYHDEWTRRYFNGSTCVAEVVTAFGSPLLFWNESLPANRRPKS